MVDPSPPAWATLNPVQKQALAPLQRDWSTIDASGKQKWLEVAGRFSTMPPDERKRLQARMVEWAKLTPAERAGARMQFQEARRLPADERQARWQAYQALSPEERQKLAQRARPPARPSAPTGTAGATAGVQRSGGGPGVDKAAASGQGLGRPTGAKSNVVMPSAKAPARVVSPTVVQARPGATTRSMNTRAAPPLHHQTGLPKIAATPGFVDPATLLPQRGPQGAAVGAAAPAGSAPRP